MKTILPYPDDESEEPTDKDLEELEEEESENHSGSWEKDWETGPSFHLVGGKSAQTLPDYCPVDN